MWVLRYVAAQARRPYNIRSEFDGHSKRPFTNEIDGFSLRWNILNQNKVPPVARPMFDLHNAVMNSFHSPRKWMRGSHPYSPHPSTRPLHQICLFLPRIQCWIAGRAKNQESACVWVF